MDRFFGSSTSASATGGSLWDAAPPPPTGPNHNYPTLLYSWWCTMCAVAIIVTRLLGRKIRSNELFREDWIMMMALAPLLIRQGLIHVVLLYRTNNVQTEGFHFTAIDLAHRTTGSRLVIAARIFYAMFLWISKLTISEFLKRITVVSWRKSYEYTLRGIRIFLFVSFGCVVIATLTECQPFDHFWQVTPDPGPQCRTGYANLISMGVCDMVTDILLVAFPIPIVLRSGQSWKRKVQLASLFSLSLIMIAVTATRVPEVIFHRGRQQYRTVWASSEILASAAVSNAVILGSFLRDKGTKRNKYRSQSVSESLEHSSVRRAPNLQLQRTNSDEDLYRSMGMRIPEHLREKVEASPRPAPIAESSKNRRTAQRHPSTSLIPDPKEGQRDTGSSESDDSLRKPIITAEPPDSSSPVESVKRSMSFFDVGGLLLDDQARQGVVPPDSCSTTLVGSSHSHRTLTHDFATSPLGTANPPLHSPISPPPPPPPSAPLSGSRAFLHDIGGLFGVASPASQSSLDDPSSPPSRRPKLRFTDSTERSSKSTSYDQRNVNQHEHEHDRSSASAAADQQQQHRPHPHPYYHAFANHQPLQQQYQYQQQQHHPRSSSPSLLSSHHARHASPPTGVLGPMLERRETQQSLQDAGGLLSPSVDSTHVNNSSSSASARDTGYSNGTAEEQVVEVEMDEFPPRISVSEPDSRKEEADGTTRDEFEEEWASGRRFWTS